MTPEQEAKFMVLFDALLESEGQPSPTVLALADAMGIDLGARNCIDLSRMGTFWVRLRREGVPELAHITATRYDIQMDYDPVDFNPIDGNRHWPSRNPSQRVSLQIEATLYRKP